MPSIATGGSPWPTRPPPAALGYARSEELLGRSAHALFHHSYPDGRPYPVDSCPLLLARIRGEVISGVEWFWDP